MSNSSDIWEQIKQIISDENLVDNEELEKIGRKMESGNINTGDWKLAVENTLIKEEEDA